MNQNYRSQRISTFVNSLFLLILIIGILSCTGVKKLADYSNHDYYNYNNIPDWKSFFIEKNLVDLIDTALERNADLKISLHQIEIASAYYKMSRGSQFPSGEIQAAALHQKNQNIEYSLNFSSAWEMDLWGKLRNSKKAAKEKLLASLAGQKLVKSILISEVSKTYFELLAFDAEMEIIEKNSKLQSSALEIVKVQKQAGKATNLAVQQFEAQLMSTLAQKNEIRKLILTNEKYLNLLLNRPPQPIPRSKDLLDQGINFDFRKIPSDFLYARPDLAEASYLLKAAGYDLKAAHAALFPSLIISPQAGLTSPSPDLFFDPQNLGWNLLTGLTAPLFKGKALKGNYLIKEAERKKALLNYQKIANTCLLEVKENLEKIKVTEEEMDIKANEVAILDSAIVTSGNLFAYGYANYLEVINAQKNVRDAELALTNIRKERNLLMIDLYRVLGGGK